MAQLVCGIHLAVQPGVCQVFFYQVVYGGPADSLMITGNKQSILIFSANNRPHLQICVQRILAGFIQVDNAYFVAFAQHSESIILNIGSIQTDELGDPQPAVQEKGEDAKITLPIWSVHVLQKLYAFIQS